MLTLKTQFVINNRFIIDPATNSVRDNVKQKSSRLEPRLMGVLCYLAAKKGQLVTRVELIKEIWDNYGGADEGLNQAISFLRKLLDDTTKEIIETIPKKGYVMHAVIGDGFEKQLPVEPPAAKINKWIIYVLTTLLVVFFIFLIYKTNNVENSDRLPTSRSNAGPDHSKDTVIGADVMPRKPATTNSEKETSMDSIGADVLRK